MTELVDVITYACNPALLLIAQVAVAGQQAHSQYQGQKFAAKAKKNFQKNAANATLEADAANFSDKQIRLAEFQDKTSDDVQRTIVKASTAGAAGSLSAMESGALGGSYDALMEEYLMKTTQLSYAQSVNDKLAVGRYLREDDMRVAQVNSRMNQIHTPIAQAQKGQAMLGFAASTLSAVGDYQGGSSPGDDRNWKSFKSDIGLG